MTRNRPGKLEQLPLEKQRGIIEIAMHSRQSDVIERLKEEGIDISPSTLSRFIRQHRGRLLVEDADAMRESVETLAARGKEGKLREGTLEAVRQRLYEQALVSQSPEEARELYAALVKEELKLKEVELEARKIATLEQQVKLQGLRIEVEMVKARSERGLKSAEVVDEAAEGEAPKQLTTGCEEEKRFRLVVERALGILNRGGPVEERMLEARRVLSGGLKEAESGG